MALESLVDTVLAEFKRSGEIKTKNTSTYAQWYSEFESEVEVFLHRIRDIDVESSEDRDQFYDYLENFGSRLQELRSRSESSDAPTEALVELEDLADLVEDTTRPAYIVSINLNETPLERQRREQREKKQKQRYEEKAREEIEELVEQIEETRIAFGDAF